MAQAPEPVGREAILQALAPANEAPSVAVQPPLPPENDAPQAVQHAAENNANVPSSQPFLLKKFTVMKCIGSSNEMKLNFMKHAVSVIK